MNNVLKKKIRQLIGALGIWSIFVIPVNAGGALVTVPNPVKYNTLEEIITAVSEPVRLIIIVTLIGVLFFGGWTRMTARDNDEQVAKSSKIIISALIGFAIVVLAPIIVDLVGGLIGVQGSLVDLGGGA